MSTRAMKSDSIEPLELKRKLDNSDGCLLLDVRTPGEFDSGHIPGAKVVPLGDLDAKAYLEREGKGCERLYVVCQSGTRARRAIELFEKAGFGGCVLVEGGMDLWTQQGLPVEKNRLSGIPVLRQVQITVGSIVSIGAVLALTVDPRFAWIPLIMGCGLVFAGVSGFCGLAILLARMPWNRMPACRDGMCGTN